MVARRLRASVVVAVALGLAACGEEDAPAEATAAATQVNRPPNLSGQPARTVVAGQAYSFAPTAADPDGDPIRFGADGLPAWLKFNATNGALTGTPQAGDVGVHRGIVVWVTDGRLDTLLPPLDIEVLPASAPVNRAPVISGTPASSVIAGSAYDFLAVASDADGDPLVFEIESRPRWASFDPAIGRLSGTPGSGDLGPYPGIIIRVSDGRETAALGPFAISVNPLPTQNRAPLISGSPDPDVLAGQAWSFQPQAADPDGNPLGFQVFGAPAWMSLNAATGLLSGTPGLPAVGTHSGIQLVVSDGQASASLPAFAVTVISPNRPPVIGGTPPTSIAKRQLYSFTPTASDPDGDPLTFTATGLPAWASINGSTGQVSGTPQNAGTFPNIVIRVSDGQATASLPAYSIAVLNSSPVISGTPPTSIARGQPYSFTPTASDPDGDTLTFTATGLPGWASINASTGQVSGTPQTAGLFANIVIRVSDGQASATLPAFAIQVSIPNLPPVISGSPPGSVPRGQPYDFTPTASDPNGDPLTFTATGLPAWANINGSTGRITGTPTSLGIHPGISITVSDGQATASLPVFSIAVVNTPPMISGTPPTSAVVGQPYSFTPTASDANGDTLAFTATGLPAWAGISGSTGQVSGTPQSAGTFPNVVITVSDGQSTASLPSFAIAVVTTNSPPVISGSPPGSVQRGQLYSFTPTASDPNGDTLTFTATGLPAWASFNGLTGRISGTPTALGTHPGISITVSDGQASASLPAFSITVLNSPPVISGTPQTSITKGQPYSFTPTASDANGDTLTFTVTGLPAWATFNGATGRISGTAGTAGTFPNIVITASDGQASASLPAFSITVVNTPPVISGTPTTSIAVGQPYSFVPTASDPNGDTLSFSVIGLPGWASFNGTTGRINGTPQSSGTFANIVISVSDGQASASLPAFSIQVFVPNSPPVISGGPPSAVLVNQAYSFTPTASDPNGDTLSFTATGLPVWASLNPATGAVTGTPLPAHVGVYSGISITVSDGTASATLGPFSIQVQSTAAGSALLSWVPPTQNTDGTPIVNLAGYFVYWGTSPGNYPNSVRLQNPGLTTYLVENLLPGTTYYFVTTAFDSLNQESAFSNMASKTIP